MRFQALMPDVLHWLGIKKIDNMISMSDLKHDAIVDSGIPIHKVRLPLPLPPPNSNPLRSDTRFPRTSFPPILASRLTPRSMLVRSSRFVWAELMECLCRVLLDDQGYGSLQDGGEALGGSGALERGTGLVWIACIARCCLSLARSFESRTAVGMLLRTRVPIARSWRWLSRGNARVWVSLFGSVDCEGVELPLKHTEPVRGRAGLAGREQWSTKRARWTCKQIRGRETQFATNITRYHLPPQTPLPLQPSS